MFKLLLCVVFAVAAADPQLLLSPGYSSLLAPSTTTITRQASSVFSPVYPYGFDHLIKKRSAPLISSYLGNYWDPNFAVPSLYASTVLPSAPLFGAHLIKKRQVLASVAPLAYTHPAVAGIPTISDGYPLVSAFDNLHFIKKRQAIWPAPLNYVASAPLAHTYSSAIIPEAPLWSSYAAGFPFIKK